MHNNFRISKRLSSKYSADTHRQIKKLSENSGFWVYLLLLNSVPHRNYC